MVYHGVNRDRSCVVLKLHSVMILLQAAQGSAGTGRDRGEAFESHSLRDSFGPIRIQVKDEPRALHASASTPALHRLHRSHPVGSP
jgi:hypothetical protein